MERHNQTLPPPPDDESKLPSPPDEELDVLIEKQSRQKGLYPEQGYEGMPKPLSRQKVVHESIDDYLPRLKDVFPKVKNKNQFIEQLFAGHEFKKGGINELKDALDSTIDFSSPREYNSYESKRAVEKSFYDVIKKTDEIGFSGKDFEDKTKDVVINGFIEGNKYNLSDKEKSAVRADVLEHIKQKPIEKEAKRRADAVFTEKYGQSPEQVFNRDEIIGNEKTKVIDETSLWSKSENEKLRSYSYAEINNIRSRMEGEIVSYQEQLEQKVQNGEVQESDAFNLMNEFKVKKNTEYQESLKNVQSRYIQRYEQLRRNAEKRALSRFAERLKDVDEDVRQKAKDYNAIFSEEYSRFSNNVANIRKQMYRNMPLSYIIGSKFYSGIFTTLATTGAALTMAGAENAGDNLTQMANDNLRKLDLPQVTRENMADPVFWAATISESLPFTIATMLPAFATGGIAAIGTGAALRAGGMGALRSMTASQIAATATAGITGWYLEKKLEAGGAYLDALQRGESESEAREKADFVDKWNNANIIMSIAEMMPAFKIGKAAKFKGLRRITESVPFGMAIEGLQEFYQGYGQARAVDSELTLGDYAGTEDAFVSTVSGALMGAGFGIYGNLSDKGGSVKTRVISRLVDEGKPVTASVETAVLNQAVTDEEAKMLADIASLAATGRERFNDIEDPVMRVAAITLHSEIGQLQSKLNGDATDNAINSVISEKQKQLSEVISGTAKVIGITIGEGSPLVATESELMDMAKDAEFADMFFNGDIKVDFKNTDNKSFLETVKQTYDSQNKTRVQGSEQIGQESVKEQPNQSAGAEKDKAGGVLQTEEELSSLQPQEELVSGQRSTQDRLSESDAISDTGLKASKSISVIDRSDFTEEEKKIAKEKVDKAKNPIVLFRGKGGKRNIKGDPLTVHPNVKGVFYYEDEQMAKHFSRGDGTDMVVVDGTTETVEAPPDTPVSKLREVETELINNSKADIVYLKTLDARGTETQVIVKNPKALVSLEPQAKSEESKDETHELAKATDKLLDEKSTEKTAVDEVVGVVKEDLPKKETKTKKQIDILTQSEKEPIKADSKTFKDKYDVTYEDVESLFESDYKTFYRGLERTLEELGVPDEKLGDAIGDYMAEKVSRDLPSKLPNKKEKWEIDDLPRDRSLNVKPIPSKVKKIDFKSKEGKIESLKPITSKDDSSINMQGVFHDADNKVLVATDAYKMVIIKDPTVNKTFIQDVTGKVSALGNGIIDAKYPDYSVIIPESPPIKQKINVQQMLNETAGLARASEFFVGKYDLGIAVKITIGDKEFFFNPRLLNEVLTVFAQQGDKDVVIQLSQPNRAMKIESGDVTAILMPVIGYDQTLDKSVPHKELIRREETPEEKRLAVQEEIRHLEKNVIKAEGKLKLAEDALAKATPENKEELLWDRNYAQRKYAEAKEALDSKNAELLGIDNQIQEQSDKEIIKQAIKDGEITEQEATAFIESADTEKVESVIEDVESKAESKSEAELNEAVSDADNAIGSESGKEQVKLSEKTETDTKKQPVNKVEDLQDVGEKIGGARKDLAQRLRDVTTDDIATKPLSKVFPEPDYGKLVSEGSLSEDAAILLKFIYDNIPPKPRKLYRVASWVKTVQGAVETAQSILEAESKKNTDFTKKIQDAVTLSPTLKRDYRLFSETMKWLGFPKENVKLGKYQIKEIELKNWNVRNGKKLTEEEKKGKVYSIVNNHIILGDFNTMEEAVAGLKKILNKTTDKKETTKFDIYQDKKTKDFFIGKKGAIDVVRVMEGFKTLGEARTFLKENQEQLQSIWDGMRNIPKERRMANRERIGVDWRKGKNITSEEFANTFGFRGVEFGNWVNNAERQSHVNEAYDALMDLASVLNVSPKALSLNGELGFAFGARGSGRANAHYEAGKVVINLTKTRGAGSLAHEWWHALDNYFSRARGEKDSFITQRPTQKMKYDNVSGLGRVAIGEDTSVRKEMIDAFKAIMDAIGKSKLKERSQELDKTRSEAYWSTAIEMSARSFENYIIDQLGKQGYLNDYLANFKEISEWINDSKGQLDALKNYPYPLEDETPIINEKFQQFFETIKEKPTEGGKTALYQILDKESQFIPITEEQFDTLLSRLNKTFGGKVKILTDEQFDKAVGDHAVRVRKTVFGAIMPDGSVYIDRSKLNANTPIHEHTHLFNSIVQKSNPKLWAAIVEAVKKTNEWGEVRNDPNYSNLKDDNEIADEAFARIVGNLGEGTWEQYGDRSIYKRVLDLIKQFYNAVLSTFGVDVFKGMSAEGLAKLTLNELFGGQSVSPFILHQNVLSSLEKVFANTVFFKNIRFQINPETKRILEKRLGERDGRALYKVVGNVKDVDKLVEFAKSKFPIKGTIAELVNKKIELQNGQIVSFGDSVLFDEWQKWQNEEIKEDVKVEIKRPDDLLKQVGYSFTQTKSQSEARQLFADYYKEGELICTIGSDTHRHNNYFVAFIVRDDAKETPHAEDLTQENLTPRWKEYLEKQGRKNKDGTFNLKDVIPKSDDPYSTSVVSLQINKTNGSTKEISRYNHTLPSPDNIFEKDFDKIVKGLDDAMYHYFGVSKNTKQYKKQLPNNVIQDAQGRYYNYTKENNGVYYGEGFYVKYGEATLLDAGSQRMVDGFVINANGTIENVAKTYKTFPYGEVQKINYIKGNEISLTTENGTFVFETQKGVVSQVKEYPKQWMFDKMKENGYNPVVNKDGTWSIDSIKKDFNMYFTKDIVEIRGNAYFNYSQITSLGNLQVIGGNADFNYSQITSLGNLQSIGGDAYFRNSPVTSLGNLQSIGGDAYFSGSPVTSLGNLQVIGGYADFNYSQITSLGNLQSIGGDAYYENSQSNAELLSKLKTKSEEARQKAKEITEIFIRAHEKFKESLNNNEGKSFNDFLPEEYKLKDKESEKQGDVSGVSKTSDSTLTQEQLDAEDLLARRQGFKNLTHKINTIRKVNGITDERRYIQDFTKEEIDNALSSLDKPSGTDASKPIEERLKEAKEELKKAWQNLNNKGFMYNPKADAEKHVALDKALLKFAVLCIKKHAGDLVKATQYAFNQLKRITGIKDIRELDVLMADAMSEYAALPDDKKEAATIQEKEKLKSFINGIVTGIKQGKKTHKEAQKEIREYIKNNLNGKFSVSVVRQLTHAVGMIIDDASFQAQRGVIERLINSAMYSQLVDEVKKQKSKLKRQAKPQLADRIRAINPFALDISELILLKKAMIAMNMKVPSYALAESVIANLEVKNQEYQSQFTPKEKTIEDIQKALDTLSNNIDNVNDYRKFINAIRSLVRTADALLRNGKITNDEYNSFIQAVFDSDNNLLPHLHDKINDFRKELVDDILSVDISWYTPTKAEEPFFKELKSLRKEHLLQLSPLTLSIMLEVKERIAIEGFVPMEQMADVIINALSEMGSKRLTKQFESTTLKDKGIEYLKMLLSSKEKTFWTRLLGVKGTELYDTILNPVFRAIEQRKRIADAIFSDMFKRLDEAGFMGLPGRKKTKSKYKIAMFFHYMGERGLRGVKDKKTKVAPDRVGYRDIFGGLTGNQKEREDYTEAQKIRADEQWSKYTPYQREIIKEIYDEFMERYGTPDGRIDLDKMEAEFESSLNEQEKALYQIHKDVTAQLEDYQRVANAITKREFNPVEGYIMRDYIDTEFGIKDDFSFATAGLNRVVIESTTGKERTTNDPMAVNLDLKELLIKGIQRTSLHYSLSFANYVAHNTINKSGIRSDIKSALRASLKDMILFEYYFSNTNKIITNITNSAAYLSLVSIPRTIAEAVVTPISSLLILSGSKGGGISIITQYNRRKTMKLMEETNSTLLDKLKLKGEKNFELKGSREFEKIGKLRRIGHAAVSISESIAMPAWYALFRSEFKSLTGLDYNKITDHSKYWQEVKQAASYADMEMKQITGGGIKAEGRERIQVFFKPVISEKRLSVLGREFKIGNISLSVRRDTPIGKMFGFLQEYPFRDSERLLGSVRNIGNAPVGESMRIIGTIINMLGYGMAAAFTRLLWQWIFASASGDDERKDEIESALQEMVQPKYYVENAIGAMVQTAGIRMSGAGRAANIILASVLYNFSEDEEQKNMIADFVEREYYSPVVGGQYSRFVKSELTEKTRKIQSTTDFIVNLNPVIRFVSDMAGQFVDRHGGITAASEAIDEIIWKIENGHEVDPLDAEFIILYNNLINVTNTVLTGRGVQIPETRTIKRELKNIIKNSEFIESIEK